MTGPFGATQSTATSRTYLSTEQVAIAAAVTTLTVPATATYAEIRLEHSDVSVQEVARSTIDGTAPTQTVGDFRFNQEDLIYTSRAELLAFQILRLTAITDLSMRVKYYA